MENKEIIYNLEKEGNIETTLQKTANELKAKLSNQFGNQYTVSAGDFNMPDKDWSHEIKIRKGNKIGASVDLKWEKSTPDILKIDVSESSKLGSTITFGVLIPFLLAGAYLGYNDIEPLAFLPGQKIAGGLGGLIALIPGLIVVYLLKSMLLKNEKAENSKLLNDVQQAVEK